MTFLPTVSSEFSDGGTFLLYTWTGVEFPDQCCGAFHLKTYPECFLDKIFHHIYSTRTHTHNHDRAWFNHTVAVPQPDIVHNGAASNDPEAGLLKITRYLSTIA